MSENKELKNDVDYGGNKYLFFVMVNKKGFLNICFFDKNCGNKNNINYYPLVSSKILQCLFNLEIIKKNKWYDMNDPELIDTIFSYKSTFDIDNFDLVVKEYNIDTRLSLKDFFINSTDKKEKLSILFGETIINNVISANDMPTNDKNTMKYSISCSRKDGFKNFINITADIYSSSNIYDDSLHMVKIYL